MNIMNIAIFHGLPNMHYEVLGYIIDYFSNIKHVNVKYYFNPIDTEKNEWIKIYESLFNININWSSINIFNPENYDLIFLVTDDDYFFKKEWYTKYGASKVVSINHLDVNRSGYQALYNLHLRHINTKLLNNWALPCYLGINKVDKLNLIENKKIKIVSVGQFLIPSAIYLKNIFENVEDLEFHVICRNNKVTRNFNFERYKYKNINIIVHIDMDTLDMINLIKECSYVFCNKSIDLFNLETETKYNEDKKYKSMSGVIPIALSYGCQLILPLSWQLNYNFKSAIVYNDNILSHKEIINNIPKIKLVNQTKEKLDIIYNELYELISHKNIHFDKILRLKNSMFVYNINNTCWFSQVCNKLNILKPNVFIETGTYLGNGIIAVKNDFREVHSIELNEKFYSNALLKFKNDKNVIMHLGDSAEVMDKIIYKINEPILFYLDAHFSGGETAFGKKEDKGCPILRELSVIGKRTHMDIVIIDDMRLMSKASYSGSKGDKLYPLTYFDFRHITMETIKNAYNKPALYYNTNDYDRLVIIPLR